MGGFALRSAAAAPCHWDGLSTGGLSEGQFFQEPQGQEEPHLPPSPRTPPGARGLSAAGRKDGCAKSCVPATQAAALPAPAPRILTATPSQPGLRKRFQTRFRTPGSSLAPCCEDGKTRPRPGSALPPLSSTRLSSGPAGRMQHLWVRWTPNAGGLCPSSQLHPSQKQPCTATPPGANTSSSCLFSRKNPFSRGAS